MVSKLLSSPYFQFLIAFVLAGAAMSGWLSITGSRVCFGIAWLVGSLGLFENFPRGVAVGFALALASVCWFAALLLVPVRQPSNVGKLVPPSSSTLLFSTTRGGGVARQVEIGDSGAIITFVAEGETKPFLELPNASLTVESVEGTVAVTTSIKGRNGDVLAELVRNEWKTSPAAWDRNYNANALEVRDGAGRIVLQVRVLPERVQLQGEWRWSGGGMRMVKIPNPWSVGWGGGLVRLQTQGSSDEPTTSGVYFFRPGYYALDKTLALQWVTPQPGLPLDRRYDISPLFRYPSENHLGELATP